MRVIWSGAAALAVLALVVAGCTPGTTADRDGRLVGRGTVLDDGSGPELCFSVAESYPPQCGGIELTNWRWPERGVERASGTTWGDFAVVGTYDGSRFRVEKTVEPAFPPGPDDELPGSPCPEPTGGWRAPDPARATHETQERAIRLAQRRPGYADLWVDEQGSYGDPLRTVLNVTFTEDVAGAEQALREVWGGPLCVSEAERTHAELVAVQHQLEKTPGFIGSGAGFGHVDLTVVHDDGSLQRELDRRYGTGLVRVGSALKPYAE